MAAATGNAVDCSGMVAGMTRALVLIDLMPRIVGNTLEPHSCEDVLARCRKLADAFRAQRDPVALVRAERPNVDEQPPGSELAQGLEHDGALATFARLGTVHAADEYL